MPADRSLGPKNLDDMTEAQPNAEKPTVSMDQTATHNSDAVKGHPRKDAAELPTHPDYEFAHEVARGGMGRVLAGRELALDRAVAVKTLLPGANAGRFVTEAKITARLPHPCIPPVYALGKLADESPFLAMKLVRGLTLAEALRSRADLTVDLPRFVQIFEQVAQAVGFAHEQGIVHRDLKPSNIMVGDFGEVQVMDWGLARDTLSNSLQRSEAETAIPADEAASTEALHTQKGAVIGTPSYMAPEQARGEVVDARADVFALGGILAAILTGQPPFHGTTVKETVTRAAAGDTKEINQRLAEVAADNELVEIARRCLQADSADRPADGEAVAECVAEYRAGVEQRLRQAEADRAASEAKIVEQGKRRRVVRIAASVITGVLLLGIIGTSIGLVNANTAWRAEADRADGERLAKNNMRKEFDRAEAALADVRRSIDRYVDVVENEELLKDPRFKEVIPKLLAEALQQYERYVEQHADSQDKEVRAELGLALVRIGRIHDMSGDMEEAIGAYERGIVILDLLVHDGPAAAELKDSLGLSLKNLGEMYQETGQQEQASAAFERARAVLESLTSENPTVAKYQGSLGKTYNSIGLFYRLGGQLDEALAEFKRAQEILLRLTTDNPEIASFQSSLGLSYRNIGIVYKATGRPHEAITEFTLAQEIQKRIAEENPHVAHYQNELAGGQNIIGNLYSDLGQPEEALAAYAEAMDIWERLVREYPTVTIYHVNLANNHNNVGNLHKTMSQPKEALAAHTMALGIRERIARENPTVTQYQNHLAQSYNNIGIIYQVTGQAEEALAAYTQAVETQERLARENPTVVEYRTNLAMNLNNIAAINGSKNQLTEALATFLRVLEIQDDLARQNPTVTEHQVNLAGTYHNIGILRNMIGQPEESLAAYLQARDSWRQITQVNPGVVAYQSRLAASHEAVGRQTKANGQPEEALDAYARALEIREDLAHEDPTAINIQQPLARTLSSIGSLNQLTGRPSESLIAYTRALEIRERLARENLDVAELSIELAGTHVTIGNLLLRDLVDAERSLEFYSNGINCLTDVLSEQPDNRRIRLYALGAYLGLAEAHDTLNEPALIVDDLQKALEFNGDPGAQNAIRNSLARAWAATGDHEEAAREAKFVVAELDESASPPTPSNRYNAACAFSLAAAAADQDENLPEPERKELQEKYAARAVQILTDLEESGYFDSEENQAALEGAADLDALRERQDFQELCARIDNAVGYSQNSLGTTVCGQPLGGARLPAHQIMQVAPTCDEPWASMVAFRSTSTS